MRPGSEAAIASGKIDRVSDFDELFSANYAAVARLVFRVTGDTGVAEELASEAFWRLHRNPPSSWANVAGWLYRTGLRLALDHLKKQRRREHYEARAQAPAAAPNPEEQFQNIEQQGRVRQVLAALKGEQASLLILRSEGYSLAEIAALMRLHQGSVGTYLARADAAFRKEYVARYGER